MTPDEKYAVAYDGDNERLETPSSDEQFKLALQGGAFDAKALDLVAKPLPKPYGLVVALHPDGPALPGDCKDALMGASLSVAAYTCVNEAVVILLSYNQARLAAAALVSPDAHPALRAAYSLPFSSWDALCAQFQLTSYSAHNAEEAIARDAKKDALSYLQGQIKAAIPVKSVLHPALDQLAAYDAENKSELLHTLAVYLENDGNAQRCSKLLFLHRNSLVYRIRRIREITGCDLNDPAERTYLRLSFLLR